MTALILGGILGWADGDAAAEALGKSEFPKLQWSGVYPHLAFFNDENECGTGAVVPWAGSLWAITYAPHKPNGSTDKLYQITPDLRRIVRPESVGGTPANRMIHRESNQLFIGPYVIDEKGQVRVISYSRMMGRHTGNARHLTEPSSKIYYATMEEGFYEVDVDTLNVAELFRDTQRNGGRRAGIPGYHGKGLYSGQGRLIYANNGETGEEAKVRPDIPSGGLAAWDGSSDEWRTIRRNQFTEVTGPGGIYGNADPESDPVWSIGWDHRSLILMVLDRGRWRSYRLPKASHSYDGAHGWNTEWPRIRDIGEEDLLMTMHGMFWRFPKTFRFRNSSGLAPRSAYLKVIGDFCRWRDRVVFGCDDTAKNEFLNKREAKGSIAAPQSQSNLWFVEPERLDDLGPVIGRGGVWLEENVEANAPSEPYLFSGFDLRGLHLAHEGSEPVDLILEVDRRGGGHWEPVRRFSLEPKGYRWAGLVENGTWARLRSERPLSGVTAWFHYANRDARDGEADSIFDGIASLEQDCGFTGGIVRARGDNKRTLHFAAMKPGMDGPEDVGYYELGTDMNLRRVEDPTAHDWLKRNAAIPSEVLKEDEASVLYVDDSGKRFRLPKSLSGAESGGALGATRVDREVSTERDLFNCHGTFYELPAENAGGFAKVRPVATHDLGIVDYCSYRGLLILSGVADTAPETNRRLIRSDDGKTALWAGAVDDLWKLGKPVGRGGPWKETSVRAGEPSDPYLMSGFDRKELRLSVRAAAEIGVEIDLNGAGLWKTFRLFDLADGAAETFVFPESFQAYWIRFRSSTDTAATAELTYR